MGLSRVFHLFVLELEDIVQAVGVTGHNASVNSINPYTVLRATRHRAAHEASIVSHPFEIVPEPFLVLIELTAPIVNLLLFTHHGRKVS